MKDLYVPACQPLRGGTKQSGIVTGSHRRGKEMLAEGEGSSGGREHRENLQKLFHRHHCYTEEF